MDICRGINEVIVSNLLTILSLRNTGRLKPDNTFISDGDLLCQRLIFDYPKENVQDYVVFSEESENDISLIDEKKLIITIDPIDGSENFVSGLKEWGVGVSIYQGGKHQQSMISLPELNVCLCSGDKIVRIKNSRICGLSSYMKAEDFAQLDGSLEYRIMGCCMYNMYNVVRGSYKRFAHLKGCYSWDILPGLNLALENGLSIMLEGEKYNGEFLCPGIRYRFSIETID
jgi:myo-inositol-1(or 4)-monophosphatase